MRSKLMTTTIDIHNIYDVGNRTDFSNLAISFHLVATVEHSGIEKKLLSVAVYSVTGI